jgi:hypothetical protein
MDSEWAAVKGGAHVVSVSKPHVETPTLVADEKPNMPARQCVPKRRCRILQFCR